ncbi:TetR family transcriptional regulator [Dietzia sp. UCD-THP]|uniref:TetR/AcrR family transcriptional regulator n=1 Tax=Dietzia sp. UCD-THP TaxID=1292020 RepID=UPI0003665DEA|nr:TetR/AcrR family transcriptional regulator [Dietzia sp. UCD-THP]EYT57230.1 TetR family transcriptional regulator [Dietzia sp. UCD-THP]
MRQSKRDTILDAAKRLIQREGVTALTFESLATESGLTKGGLLYHFPSRDDLLRGLHAHVAGRWEQCMESEAGGPAEEVDDDARFAAFVRSSQFPDRAELLLMLEAVENPATNAVWEDVYRRWVPDTPAAVDDDVMTFIARLAADGLWLYESLESQKLDPAVRERVVEEIIRLAE